MECLYFDSTGPGNIVASSSLPGDDNIPVSNFQDRLEEKLRWKVCEVEA